MVHEGDVEALAAAMRISVATLRNKANPNSLDHEPTLQQTVTAAAFTSSPLIAEAFCELAGGVFVPTPGLSEKTVPELYQAVHQVTRELGDVLREIDESLKDGRMSPAERDKVQRNIYELIEKAATLGKRVALMAEPLQLKAVKT